MRSWPASLDTRLGYTSACRPATQILRCAQNDSCGGGYGSLALLAGVHTPECPTHCPTWVPASAGTTSRGWNDELRWCGESYAKSPCFGMIRLSAGALNTDGGFSFACYPFRLAWSAMSTPTISLHAAMSCLTTGPGTSPSKGRLSIMEMGRTEKLVAVMKASSAV